MTQQRPHTEGRLSQNRSVKRKLKKQYESLNPAELKRTITKLQNKLLRLSALKTKVNNEKDFVYNFHEATI